MTARGKLVKRSKALQAAIEAIESGAQRAAISEGGGSKDYTRADISKLYEERTRINGAIRCLDRKSKVIRTVGISIQ